MQKADSQVKKLVVSVGRLTAIWKHRRIRFPSLSAVARSGCCYWKRSARFISFVNKNTTTLLSNITALSLTLQTASVSITESDTHLQNRFLAGSSQTRARYHPWRRDTILYYILYTICYMLYTIYRYYYFTILYYRSPTIRAARVRCAPSSKKARGDYIYIYIYTHNVYPSLSLYIYIYIYVSTYLSLSLYIYIYTYIYIHMLRHLFRCRFAGIDRSSACLSLTDRVPGFAPSRYAFAGG